MRICATVVFQHINTNERTTGAASRTSTAKRDAPILLCAHARTRHLEQAVRAVVPADFDEHTTVAPYRIALLAEEQVVQRVEAVRRRRELWGWRMGRLRQTGTIVLNLGGHPASAFPAADANSQRTRSDQGRQGIELADSSGKLARRSEAPLAERVA